MGEDKDNAARNLAIGQHVVERARKLGWKDDGEGAYEFIVRSSYELGAYDTVCRGIDPVQDAKLLRMGPNGERGWTIDITGRTVAKIAGELAAWLNAHEAVNYTETQFTHYETPFTVTVQRDDGKTPHQLRREAEKQLADLRDAADNAYNVLLACCVPAGGKDDRQSILNAQKLLREALKPEGKDASNG